MRKTVLISCLLSAFAGQGLAQTQTTSRQDIPRLVASARGTVVLIKSFDSHGQVLGLGSGFRVSGGRYVTNAHVVAGASRVEIFDDAGALLGIARSADMLSTTVDLAILGSLGPRAPYLSLASAAPAVGEQIIVIGAPEGLTNTVSDGIVSAMRRIGNRQLLQISAPISPGSSGGPVLNTRGEVVGVSVSIMREGQNLNFAVPVSDVIALVSSRAGQFEFPASTADVSQSPPKTGGSTRSNSAPTPAMLSVGSVVKGQLTPVDIRTSEGYVDYYRLRGPQGTSVSISISSTDFDPFIAVFRFVGDSLATLGSADNSGGGTSAEVSLTLSSEVSYVVGVGVSSNSHAPMGGYTLRVVENAPQAEPPSSRTSDANDRWVEAGTADAFVNEFDRTRIVRGRSGTYLVWERVTYAKPYTTRSGLTYNVVMTQYEMSCTDTNFRSQTSIRYLRGAVVWSDYQTSEWRSPVPESVAEISGRVICAYIKSHGL